MTDIASSSTNQARLFAKVAAVMAEVERIPKNGKNSFHNYRYATESDILDGVRPILARQGLALFIDVINSSWRDGPVGRDEKASAPIVTVEMRFTLGCAETGATMTTTLMAEGQDGGDKGYYKAYTGGLKYWLSKTFLISSGDDPEQDHVERERPARLNTSAPPAQQVRAAARSTTLAVVAPNKAELFSGRREAAAYLALGKKLRERYGYTGDDLRANAVVYTPALIIDMPDAEYKKLMERMQVMERTALSRPSSGEVEAEMDAIVEAVA